MKKLLVSALCVCAGFVPLAAEAYTAEQFDVLNGLKRLEVRASQCGYTKESERIHVWFTSRLNELLKAGDHDVVYAMEIVEEKMRASPPDAADCSRTRQVLTRVLSAEGAPPDKKNAATPKPRSTH